MSKKRLEEFTDDLERKKVKAIRKKRAEQFNYETDDDDDEQNLYYAGLAEDVMKRHNH